MPLTHLLVTRPPCPDGIAPQVAPLLGLPVYETKVFLRHPLPDIVKISDSAGGAEGVAASLKAAGVPLDVVPVDALVSLSTPLEVKTFALSGDAATFTGKDGEATVPWAALAVVVLRQTEVTSKGPTSSGTPERVGKQLTALGNQMGGLVGGLVGGIGKDLATPVTPMKTVTAYQSADLVWRSPEGIRRVRIEQQVLLYDGLGEKKKPLGYDNWRTLLAEIRARAPKAAVDEAMVKGKPRAGMVDGKVLSAHLVNESEAVKKVVGDPFEFHSALCAWKTTQGAVPEAAPAFPGPSPAPIAAAVAAPPPAPSPIPPAPSPVAAKAPAPVPAAPRPPAAVGGTSGVKGFCAKCFKDVDLTPDNHCTVCGKDLTPPPPPPLGERIRDAFREILLSEGFAAGALFVLGLPFLGIGLVVLAILQLILGFVARSGIKDTVETLTNPRVWPLRGLIGGSIVLGYLYLVRKPESWTFPLMAASGVAGLLLLVWNAWRGWRSGRGGVKRVI